MGDTKKSRKKYQRPLKPWQKERIEEEREIKREYGLKNKKELWKMAAFLQRFKHNAKRLASGEKKQQEKERTAMINRLQRYGLLKKGGQIDDILGLSLKDVMERRVQTLLVRKGLARTIDQARQFIVHRHVLVNGKRVTSPSYLVPLEEEPHIGFYGNSALAKEDHPERQVAEKKKAVESQVEKK